MQNKTPKQKELHQPVLLTQVLSVLRPQKGESYLDLTAGYAGHAPEILEKTQNPADTLLVDRDMFAVEYLQKKFFGTDAQVVHDDFYSASQKLIEKGVEFQLILADLGVSSPHLDNASRGFSFMNDGPLDMRMDQHAALDADTIVNSWSEGDLRDVLVRYGEEPKAAKIARLIVEHRPITSTAELAKVVARAWPGHSKTHPATRTFQALRIAVNDELSLLEKALPLMERLLAPGGRLAIITFHSLEDRVVKQYFKEHADSYDASLTSLTKKPLTAGADEVVYNPRARSAKLRAVAKIKK